MSADVRKSFYGSQHLILLSEAERKAWELPPDMSVSEWADKFRVLDPMTSAEPGQWVTARTPYLKEPMDSYRDPDIEEIVLMMSTQVGKTECMLNMLGYTIDQDPAPTLFIMPRDTDARSMSEDRIESMCRLSPSISNELTGKEDDIRKMKLIFKRMILYLQGANSPAGLASKPIGRLFFDEVDKYPPFSGKEASPIKLATERTRTFWNRKIVKCSTPTTHEAYIYNEYEKTDKRRFYLPCVHCGHFQILIWPQIKFPKNVRNPDQIKNERLAHYECIECKVKIKDIHKQAMLQKGVWSPDGCTVNKDGTFEGEFPKTLMRGYWINALYSPWLTFSQIASEFLKSIPKVEDHMNFVNSWLAEVWEETIQDAREEDDVDKLVLPYKEGTVPAGVLVITAAVDVQKDHFYLSLRGWGYNEESWGIRKDQVESWEEVETILFKTTYTREDGKLMQVRLALIDSGFRTDEVYDFCMKWRGITRPIKGMSQPTGIPYYMRKIEKHPGTGLPIKGGLALYSVDTGFYKDKISRLVKKDLETHNQWHIFKDPSESYKKQFTSEHKVIERNRKTKSTKTVWKTKGSHTPNHWWDTEVYSTAAAAMLHVWTLRKEEKKSERQQPQKEDPWLDRPRRGGWIHG